MRPSIAFALLSLSVGGLPDPGSVMPIDGPPDPKPSKPSRVDEPVARDPRSVASAARAVAEDLAAPARRDVSPMPAELRAEKEIAVAAFLEKHPPANPSIVKGPSYAQATRASNRIARTPKPTKAERRIARNTRNGYGSSLSRWKRAQQ